MFSYKHPTGTKTITKCVLTTFDENHMFSMYKKTEDAKLKPVCKKSTYIHLCLGTVRERSVCSTGSLHYCFLAS